MPSELDALLLYSPRLKAWCEAMRDLCAAWERRADENDSRDYRHSVETREAELRGAERIQAWALSTRHRSSYGPGCSSVWQREVDLLTPPAPDNPMPPDPAPGKSEAMDGHLAAAVLATRDGEVAKLMQENDNLRREVREEAAKKDEARARAEKAEDAGSWGSLENLAERWFNASIADVLTRVREQRNALQEELDAAIKRAMMEEARREAMQERVQQAEELAARRRFSNEALWERVAKAEREADEAKARLIGTEDVQRLRNDLWASRRLVRELQAKIVTLQEEPEP